MTGKVQITNISETKITVTKKYVSKDNIASGGFALAPDRTLEPQETETFNVGNIEGLTLIVKETE